MEAMQMIEIQNISDINTVKQVMPKKKDEEGLTQPNLQQEIKVPKNILHAWIRNVQKLSISFNNIVVGIV
jgi:hypothetical protein